MNRIATHTLSLLIAGILAAHAQGKPLMAESPATVAKTQSKPNVVLIISDDHAWTDYSFQGHPRARTLAVNGTRIPERCSNYSIYWQIRMR